MFFYLFLGQNNKDFYKKIVKYKHHLNKKVVGTRWNVDEWPKARWDKEERNWGSKRGYISSQGTPVDQLQSIKLSRAKKKIYYQITKLGVLIVL